MNDRIDARTKTYDAHRRLVAESLKRCPLCGAVNALSNGECFVCRWSGLFEHDPDQVEEGLNELLDRCPELANAINEPITWSERVFEFRDRLRDRIREHLSGRIGVRFVSPRLRLRGLFGWLRALVHSKLIFRFQSTRVRPNSGRHIDILA